MSAKPKKPEFTPEADLPPEEDFTSSMDLKSEPLGGRRGNKVNEWMARLRVHSTILRAKAGLMYQQLKARNLHYGIPVVAAVPVALIAYFAIGSKPKEPPPFARPAHRAPAPPPEGRQPPPQRIPPQQAQVPSPAQPVAILPPPARRPPAAVTPAKVKAAKRAVSTKGKVVQKGKATKGKFASTKGAKGVVAKTTKGKSSKTAKSAASAKRGIASKTKAGAKPKKKTKVKAKPKTDDTEG